MSNISLCIRGKVTGLSLVKFKHVATISFAEDPAVKDADFMYRDLKLIVPSNVYLGQEVVVDLTFCSWVAISL